MISIKVTESLWPGWHQSENNLNTKTNTISKPQSLKLFGAQINASSSSSSSSLSIEQKQQQPFHFNSHRLSVISRYIIVGYMSDLSVGMKATQ